MIASPFTAADTEKGAARSISAAAASRTTTPSGIALPADTILGSRE